MDESGRPLADLVHHAALRCPELTNGERSRLRYLARMIAEEPEAWERQERLLPETRG